MASYAVGLIVEVNGVPKVIVELIDANTEAEALGKIIIDQEVKLIKDWSIKSNHLNTKVEEYLLQNQKIKAIQFVRTKLNLSLMEAKAYVEKIGNSYYP